MSKNILIVESDGSQSRAMREALTTKGFIVEETSDGKGCVELVRKSRPQLVVLAVELAAGQNGYIICGKLKGDEDLRQIPVIIIGNPEGFAQHRKLKTKKADDYLAKPFEGPKIVEPIGKLIGMPEPPAEQEVVEDESLSLSELLTDDDKAEASGGSELAAEDLATGGDEPSTREETVAGDPDLDMLDSVFDEDKPEGGASAADPDPIAEDLQVEEELHVEDETADSSGQKTSIGFMPDAPPPPPPPSSPRASRAASHSTGGSASEHAELLELRSKVTELNGSLSDAKSRADDLEAKLRESEVELESKRTELEASRAGGGKSDKEVFALRDAGTKKDKEILRLKNELNEKEKELIDLQEKSNSLEQQASESSGEIARRDAQIKTLTTKSDQLATERKRIDQQLISAKEEARSSGAKLTTLQSELEQVQARLAGSDAELDQLRSSQSELESEKQRLESDLAEVRGEAEATKSQLEHLTTEADEQRSLLEAAQIDLDSAKGQLTSQAAAFADEIGTLRRRIGELEEKDAKNEERVQKLYARIKSNEERDQKTRETLQQVINDLEASPVDIDVISEDEIAEA